MKNEMDKNEIKQQFLERDRAVRIITKDGMFRAVAIKNTNCAIEAQRRHKLGHVSGYFLAKTLAAGSMLAMFLKGEERIMLDISGNGPLEKVFAEAVQVGEVRGYAHLAKPDEEIEIENISDAIGKGTLKVTRVLYNKNEPVTGIIELADSDIQSDLVHYFTQSEQIPSAVRISAELDGEGNVVSSGGLIVHAMPGATKEQIDRVFGSVSKLASPAKLLADGLTPEELLIYAIPQEIEVLKSTPVDFYCRCSKESFVSKLTTLTLEELKDMQRENKGELVCRHCNEHYYLDENDYKQLIIEKQAKSN